MGLLLLLQMLFVRVLTDSQVAERDYYTLACGEREMMNITFSAAVCRAGLSCWFVVLTIPAFVSDAQVIV